MFGTNLVADYVETPRPGDSTKLQVRSIFLTLQGEGPYSGRRAVFIRLSRCSLRCHFCDTAWDDLRDEYMEPLQIAEKARRMWGDLPSPLYVITGGEPLLQPIDSLLWALRSPGATIQIETAGIYWRDTLSANYVSVVISPKTPVINPRTAAAAMAFKYVISHTDPKCPDTGIPITATQRGVTNLQRLALPPGVMPRQSVYMSPCDDIDEDNNKKNLDEAARLAMKHGYTLGVQLHKLVGID